MNLNDLPLQNISNALLGEEVEVPSGKGRITMAEYFDNGYLMVMVEMDDGSVTFKQWDHDGNAVKPIHLEMKSLHRLSEGARDFLYNQGVKR